VTAAIRALTEADREQAHRLSMLAFGGDLRAPVPPEEDPPPGPYFGAFDPSGRLVAKARSMPFEQWWCGAPVAMAGIAGVAVAPEARGQGLVGRLMEALLAESGAPISTLFPTAPGIYRPFGWEVVGSMDRTPIPLADLPRAGDVQVHPATDQDLAAIGRLYDDRGAGSSGLLVRRGPCFSEGLKGILKHDVVTVAHEGGEVTGFLTYSRGRGYSGDGELMQWDCIAQTAQATQALLASLSSWSSVAATVSWRGSTEDLALHLKRTVKPTSEARPWMLRIVDPIAAVAARGFAPGTTTASFAVAGQGYRLELEDRRGQLTAVPGEGLAEVHPRGLALLHAGVATGRLARNGLADRDLPELEEAFRGPKPEILDYF
jgi:predicted acetyltransferase